MSVVMSVATNSIPPLDGEGGALLQRAGWGEMFDALSLCYLSAIAPAAVGVVGIPRKGEVMVRPAAPRPISPLPTEAKRIERCGAVRWR
jgi:hypothetical protein